SVHCVNEEPLLDRYSYLDQEKVVLGLADFQAQNPGYIPDLVIVVDTNSITRIGKKLQGHVSPFKNILFIDHHPCRGRSLETHCVDEAAAATGQLVGEMIDYLGIKFT